jgi:ankyrin repeat protein
MLHQAVELGLLELIDFLLKPPHIFPIDLLGRQENSNCPGFNTPLQLAVRLNNLEAARALIRKGANIHVLTKHNYLNQSKTLLQIACEEGYVPMAELLINSGCDVTVKTTDLLGTFNESLLQFAITCKKVEARISLVELLLNHEVPVGVKALVSAIWHKLPMHLIKRIGGSLSKDLLLSSFILHRAVRANSLEAVKWLVEGILEQHIMQRDIQGCTALHLATEKGCEAIFHYLKEKGSLLDIPCYEGFTVREYALLNGTLEHLGLTLPTNYNRLAFEALKVDFVETTEFARMAAEFRQFPLSLYCYKLISLFDNVEDAKKFVQTFTPEHSYQPLHDVCLFSLPYTGNWNKAAWASLALAHGLSITQNLHWAPRIEALLGRPPLDIEEINAIIPELKFNRESENSSLAKLCYKHKIPEQAFERALEQYKEKTTDDLPDVRIEGSLFNQPRYYLKKLSPTDLRGFVLGAITHCCQSIGSQGESCAMHGMTSKYGGFYVVFKQLEEKEQRKLAELLEKARTSKAAYSFLTKLKERDQRSAYRKKLETIQDEHQLINTDDALPFLCKDLEEKLEGEIVAQAWVWLSKQDNLVLDSWEVIRPEENRVCEAVLRQLAIDVIKNYPAINKVLIGKNGQTPQDLPFKSVEKPEEPKDYYSYRDSAEQLLILDRVTYEAQLQPSSSATFHSMSSTATLLTQQSSIYTQVSPIVPYTPSGMLQLLTKYVASNRRIICLSSLESTLENAPAKLLKLSVDEACCSEVSLWQKEKPDDNTNHWLIIPIHEANTHKWTVVILQKYLHSHALSGFVINHWYIDYTGQAIPEMYRMKLVSCAQFNNNTVQYCDTNEPTGVLLLHTVKILVEKGYLSTPPVVDVAKLYAAQKEHLKEFALSHVNLIGADI